MPIVDNILNELSFESPVTARVLERVPLEKSDWKPHERSMSLGALAWHLAGIPARVEGLLRSGEFDLSGARPSPPSGDTDLVGTFQRNLDSVRAYLQSLKEEELRESFRFVKGGQVLREIPKSAMIRSILLNHSYHHRGQLSVYLRLLDVPVPAIYGSSADENPFA
ncbi:MAG TPA: DinB family protein [Thermoanaerobaculia bacterium]|jgi:uncharacterized damage-inducible protein DinB